MFKDLHSTSEIISLRTSLEFGAIALLGLMVPSFFSYLSKRLRDKKFVGKGVKIAIGKMVGNSAALEGLSSSGRSSRSRSATSGRGAITTLHAV